MDDGSDSEEELAAFCPKVMKFLGNIKAQLNRTNSLHCVDMQCMTAYAAHCS